MRGADPVGADARRHGLPHASTASRSAPCAPMNGKGKATEAAVDPW